VDPSALRSPRGALALLLGAPLTMLATSLLRVHLRLPLPGLSGEDPAAQLSAHPAQAAALFAWLALVVIALWWRGVRGFFAPLRHGNALRDRLRMDG
jgi:hypothetical protein